jgi:hypothetical protein
MTPYGSLCLPPCQLIDLLHMLTADHRWRRLRRVTVEGYSKSAVPDFYPIQGREALMLALALIKNPPDTEKHLQRHGSSIMLSVNYHLPPVDSEDDPIIVGVMKHVERLMHETRPGTRLVEFFTWMRYIPSRCVYLLSCALIDRASSNTCGQKVCQVETRRRVLVRPRYPHVRASSQQSYQ